MMTDEPMFERQYDVQGSKRKINLKIFEPTAVEGGDWECTYLLEASHLGWESKLRWAPGGDKLGALASAFAIITIDLRALARRSGSYVTFRGDKNLDLIDRDFY